MTGGKQSGDGVASGRTKGWEVTLETHRLYRVTQRVSDLGWVDLDLESSQLVGCYHSYLLPEQDDGKYLLEVNPTQV